MDSLSWHYTLRWLVAVWLFGWLTFPYSRRIFLHLPDNGLAAGRVLFLVLISLGVYWGASFHILALSFATFSLFGLPLLGALLATAHFIKRNGLRFPRLYANRYGLILSELIFLGSFSFFLYLRLCRPEINDFEKPMDSAIIGSLSRAQYLPAENPWFAGSEFTNYYYFGHFMGALIKRTLSTPLPYAYNLIQPAFCALFVSTLWSLCVALCRSRLRGSLAMIVVAFAGNFEPLRQWLDTSSLARSSSFPFLDWWSTSRVIPGTINEYPFFTLAIGDAHAHFFAFSLAALLFCLCYELCQASSTKRQPYLIACLSSIVLGAMIMTNSWDFPIYFLLTVACLGIAGRALLTRQVLTGVFVVLGGALFVAFPFLHTFQSQTGGIAWEWWQVPVASVLLIWSGFLAFWLLFLGLHVRSTGVRTKDHIFKNSLTATSLVFILALFCPFLLALALVLLLGLTTFILCSECISTSIAQRTEECVSSDTKFVFLLGTTGLFALFLPILFYQRGYFGGELRHQDTVFKFGLQAWLLLGTAASCGILSFASNTTIRDSMIIKIAKNCMCLLWIIPIVCSYSVWQARSTHVSPLSLCGAQHRSLDEQQALHWLEENAAKESMVIEAVGRDQSGQFTGAYGEYGRVSALTGIPAYIGWPQHAGFWGAKPNQIQMRLQDTEALFMKLCSPGTPNKNRDKILALLEHLSAQRTCYIFIGDLEHQLYTSAPVDFKSELGIVNRAQAIDRTQLTIAYHQGSSWIIKYQSVS